MLVHSIESGIAAPIFESEKVVGCLYFDRREDLTELYDREDLDDARAFADCFADGIQHFLLRRSQVSA